MPLPALQSTLRLDPAVAVRAVAEYNAGSYRGRTNIELDRIAYDRFRDGIPEETDALIDLVRFVGEDFGGAQRRFLPHGYREEAALIVQNLRPLLGPWRSAIGAARPLREVVPTEATFGLLLAPFVGTKRWPVWASKTLHFVRPDAFPILDSRAKIALGMRSLGSSPSEYRRFCMVLLEVLAENREAIDAARRVDGGTSPSDLKLLDKILYQLGE